MERTYLMIKPDGVQRGLIGEIVSRFRTQRVEADRSKAHERLS